MTSETRRNRARSLRRRATDAEQELWRHLRARLPVEGSYFRRQVPIGPYFVDFACFRYRLVIELDGSQHGTEAGLAADIARTRHLEGSGFRVLRFWNYQVFINIDAVLDTIYGALRQTAARKDRLQRQHRERLRAEHPAAPLAEPRPMQSDIGP